MPSEYRVVDAVYSRFISVQKPSMVFVNVANFSSQGIVTKNIGTPGKQTELFQGMESGYNRLCKLAARTEITKRSVFRDGDLDGRRSG